MMRSCLVLFFLLSALPAIAAPLTLRIAWTAVPLDLTPVLIEQKDMLDHLGQSYAVEPVHFGEAATVVRALQKHRLLQRPTQQLDRLRCSRESAGLCKPLRDWLRKLTATGGRVPVRVAGLRDRNLRRFRRACR